MNGQWKLYVPINLLPDGPDLSFPFFFHNYSAEISIQLQTFYQSSTHYQNPFHWCSRSCLHKNKCDLSWKYFVWNVNRCKAKSSEIYKNLVCFWNADCTEISVVCGLNKTSIFSDHIQSCQLAFVWACEIDSCECCGKHNRDTSSQWVGRWGRHWCKAAVMKQRF